MNWPPPYLGAGPHRVGHAMTQEINRTEAELIFGKWEMGTILLARATGNENVNHIIKQKVQAVTHRIHQALESLRGVLPAKWHTGKFKQSERSDNGRLWHALQAHRNLMITP